jgi:C4-dicarboxylate transporter DctM subunit
MDPLTVAAIVFAILILMLATGLWVAMSLFAAGMVATLLFTDAPAGMIAATTSWGQSWSWALTPLPLFVWMGEILFRTRLATDMFNGLAPWLRKLPGGLMHVNVLSCGIFAAVSGSSAATTATIGRITIPELMSRGYDERMVLGSLAGSATLGLLVPPSIILIVYGVAADVSITRLFVAGVLPGLMIVLLFMAGIVFWALTQRGKFPAPGDSLSLVEKIKQSLRLIPVAMLITCIVGSIYTGIATATEAAAIGVLGSLAILAAYRELDWRTFSDSLINATLMSAMITFILAGAAFLSVAMGFTAVPRALAEWVNSLGLGPGALLFALTILFIVLGCFLDGISIVVLTVAVILPMVEAAGFDLIWFGIFLVIVVEMSQITPPIGFNLFVIQSLTQRDILYIARAALPAFFMLGVAILLIYLVPGIVLMLPQNMYGN